LSSGADLDFDRKGLQSLLRFEPLLNDLVCWGA
jgi:hypothetical protein